MQRPFSAALFAAIFTTAGAAQTPQPFPRPATGQPEPARAAVAVQQPQGTPPQQGATSTDADPSAASLGIAVYPAAQFLTSYDAGRGQRYYLFGTTASFAEVVAYYRTQLDERGNQVFEVPATHMFTGGRLGRYREETMAFPPSVTIKDWTGGGLTGYPNLKLGAQPERFPTIIMIVPAPPGAAR